MYQSDLSTDIRNYLKQEITKSSEGRLNWKLGITCPCSVIPLQLRCRGQEAAGNQYQQSQFPGASDDHTGGYKVMCQRLSVSHHP